MISEALRLREACVSEHFFALAARVNQPIPIAGHKLEGELDAVEYVTK